MKQTYSLPNAMTVYAVGMLRSQFGAWIAELPKGRRGAALTDSPLIVDARRVDEVDAAGIQLLVALSKSLTVRRRPLKLLNPSRSLVQGCDALAVASLLIEVAVNGAPG